MIVFYHPKEFCSTLLSYPILMIDFLVSQKLNKTHFQHFFKYKHGLKQVFAKPWSL